MHNKNLFFPKAKRFSSKRPIIRMPVWAEQKLDGWRMMFCKGRAYGRNINDLGFRENLWDKLPDHLQDKAMDDFVDGELIWPGKDSSAISTGLAERNPALDFIGYRMVDKNYLPHIHLSTLENLGFKVPLHLDGYIPKADFDYEVLLALAEELHWEGFIIKEKYPVPVWWKLKLEHTYDLLVTGINMPTSGRFFVKGWIKSIRCSALIDGELAVIADVSGFSDEVRSVITEADIGRVVEVESNLRASRGKLRHPRFLRWRDDKDASQIFETGS